MAQPKVYNYSKHGTWAIVAYKRGAPERFFRFRGVENVYLSAEKAMQEKLKRWRVVDTMYLIKSIPFVMCDIEEVPWKVTSL